MAGERKITVSFDGKDVGLGSSVDDVVGDLDKVDRAGRDAGEGMASMVDHADTAESRFEGLGYSISGAQGAMEGFSQLQSGDAVGGILTMTMGFADLASGVKNLIAPFAGQVAAWVTGRGAMATADATGAAVSSTSWLSMAATSLAGAAQVALAWLISIGPVLIVIAVIVGLVALIVIYWDQIKAVIQAGWEYVKQITSAVWDAIKTGLSAAWDAIKSLIQTQIDLVKSIISGAWDAIKTVTTTAWGLIKQYMIDPITQAKDTITRLVDAVMNVIKGIPDKVKSALGTVADMITGPFKTGFDGIKSAWNNTVGGKGFTVPSWVPGVGGKSFTIPKLALGGLAFGPTLAMIGDNVGASRDPEVVAPLSKLRGMLGGGDQPVHVQVIIDNQVLFDAIRKGVSNRGGLQAALG